METCAMAIYETITVTQKRSQIHQRELNLGFDLSTEFCSAAWHALSDPIEAVLAATNQPAATRLDSPRDIHLTKPLLKAFGDIALNAVRNEAKRLNVEFPKDLDDPVNVERLVAGCINIDHLCVAHRYTAKTVFDR
jgi:hypothetical protein